MQHKRNWVCGAILGYLWYRVYRTETNSYSELSAMMISTYEYLARLKPTEQSYSLISALQFVLELIMPDNGRYHDDNNKQDKNV